MDCLFCKIGNKEIPSYILYEDETVLAFLDIHPQKNGHTLIIPKKHYTDFTDLDPDTFLHILEVAQKITTLLKEKLSATGFSLVTNYLMLQEVKHFHLHIIPNTKDKLKDVESIYNQLKN